MAVKRSVILQGQPNVNENGTATEAIKPGYLVKGVSAISLQTSTGKVPCAIALERSELGVGLDNTYQSSGVPSAFYASGDQVKVAVFAPGDVFTGFIQSGAVISEDDLLVSAGDGTFKEGTSDVVARALDTLSVLSTVQACRMQAI